VRVLVVSAHPPLPLDNGGRLRTFHLLEELSQRAEVKLVTLDRVPGGEAPCTADAIEHALPALQGTRTVAIPAARKRGRQLATLISGDSYTLHLYRTPALVAAVREGVLEFEPDIVHCETLFCAYVLPSAREDGPRWVLSMFNHESLLKRRLANDANEWLRRALYRREATALQRLERRYIPRFDHVLAVSDRERDVFAALGTDALTIPNGATPLPEPQGPPQSPAPGEPLRLLFVGSLNYEPNARGIEWFANEVAPRVRERVAIDIEVVGPGRRGPELPGVRYLGRLEDLGPAYERAHAAVVPLRAGAGSRLKVVEALARGVPLVSTSLGVEGYDLIDGVHALIADDPAALAERFARLDSSLRTNQQLAARLVKAGYEFAAGHFWPRVGERLVTAYEHWANHGSSQAP
jgi:polysaccharide biosynthesis protein PslH